MQSKITDIPKEQRPRERALSEGIQSLDNDELLALMFGSGVKGRNAIELAHDVLSLVDNKIGRLQELNFDLLTSQFKGIGAAKALNVLAAIEFGRRAARVELPPKITSSEQIVKYIAPELFTCEEEQFWVFYLNQSNRVIYSQCVAKGGTAIVSFDVKPVMRTALNRLAASLILCHNHPSGSAMPSTADIQMTKQVRNAAAYFNIRLLDHIIIPRYVDVSNDKPDYYSMADNGDF